MKTKHKKQFIPICIKYSDGTERTIMVGSPLKNNNTTLYLEDSHSTHVAWNPAVRRVKIAKGRGIKFNDKFKHFDF